ncbi:unnamed protein product [Vitrella brassicaformis CCMP3155]|uniref:TLDc domain-containing protein n=1 Tax=Vitrella brassicaformis (strain CCMP3155) TaxID=1169540 RepID=A0A0G4EU52_VITBC|nr:unnamed protein product [Vitrella brassicaformis CCMP3155]|eukprot:CEM01935.1 unnamed protein product [Vitrella brassicaformis CCMP3155]
MLELIGGCDTIDGDFDASIEQLTRAKRVLTDEISRLVASRGGVSHPAETTGEMLVNAGGVVFPVSRRALLLPCMKRRYISVLLMLFADGLPRDADGHVYLETSPAYFEALLDELTLYETGRTNTVDLPPSKAADPAYSEYHSLFMRELPSFAPPTHSSRGAAMARAVDAACDEKALGNVIQTSLSDLEKVMKRLTRRREEVVRFLSAMEPFMKGQDDTGDDLAVLSLNVLGRQVVIQRRTLLRLGADHPLLTRFSNTLPCWGDRRVRQTPTKHFVNTVEFARRIAMLKGQLIRPPLMDESERELFREDLAMYGLTYSPILDLPSGQEWVITSPEEWVAVLDLMDRPTCRPSLLFKSSRDGGDFGTLLDKVGDASGLLFLINHNDTHRFGAFVDGRLKPPTDPTDPTQTSSSYFAPQFLISISGAYAVPTKVPIPTAKQTVHVAGRDAFQIANDQDSRGKLSLGWGYLWFGWATPGPSDDVRSMNQFVKEEDLPDNGYLGQLNSSNEGTLAGEPYFTAKEMEIWHIETARGGWFKAAAPHAAVGVGSRKPKGFMSWLWRRRDK